MTVRPGSAAATTSARNRLPGRVVHVSEGPERVRLTVDADGVALQVDVTPEAALDLRLAVGSDVTCEFKAHAVELLE